MLQINRNSLESVIDLIKNQIILRDEIMSTFPINIDAELVCWIHDYDIILDFTVYLKNRKDAKIVCNWLMKNYGTYKELIYADGTIYQDCEFSKQVNGIDYKCNIKICNSEGISCKIVYDENEVTEIRKTPRLICK